VFSNVTFLAEKPQLRRPILIEGLPGIGYVANIVALHLINELKAKKLCDIHSPSFQAFSLTAREGTIQHPINELYYGSVGSMDRDLIVLFGNSQAGDTRGQYALCRQILDIVQGLGCELLVTIGGLKRDSVASEPNVFCAASDPETLQAARDLGAETMSGHIYGAAGLLVGLARLRKMRGLCVLSETSGSYADVVAARSALRFICRFLGADIDCSRLDHAVEANRRLLGSFSQTRSQTRKGSPSTI
jgi:uncharacterized protein (TIGR00162 family)